jgi:uncharacterized protein involved in outer membrane biogenesis
MFRAFVSIVWFFAVLGLMLSLALLILNTINFNDYRQQVEQQASSILQQKVRIRGEIGPGLIGWNPSLVLHKVEVGDKVKADKVEVTVQSLKTLQKFYARVSGLRFSGRLLGNYDIPVLVRDDGFEVTSLAGEMGDATLTGTIKYTGNTLRIDGALKNLPLGFLAEEAEGRVDGKIKLEGKGDNGDALMRTLNGRFMLINSGGKLTSKSLNFWSRGLLNSLIPGKKDSTELNCAIVDFNVENGMAFSRAIIVDTKENTVFAKGSVTLDGSKVDLVLKPNPKDIDLLSVATPVHVTGPLDNAVVTPQAGGVAKKVGEMLLGVVNPALAIIPLVETGFGDYKGSCADILKQQENKHL